MKTPKQIKKSKVRDLTEEQKAQFNELAVELAGDLHSFVYGHDAEYDDQEMRENYIADAVELLRAMPHLLPLTLREDMADPDAEVSAPRDEAKIEADLAERLREALLASGFDVYEGIHFNQPRFFVENPLADTEASALVIVESDGVRVLPTLPAPSSFVRELAKIAAAAAIA